MVHRTTRGFLRSLGGPAAGLLALGLSACTKEPAEIRVKGPRDALESTKMNPVFAPFEKKNDTLQLRASAFDDDGVFMGPAKVSWDSSDRKVATVSQDGLVTILGSGKAEIKATGTGYQRSLEASLPVQAVIVDDIRLVEPAPQPGKVLQLPMGEIMMFKAEVLDDRGEVIPDAKIKWISSSWAATVAPDGEVEGRAIGTAQIVAEAKNGKKARIELEVVDWKKPAKKKR